MKLPTSLITFLNSLAFSVLALQSNHAHPQPDLFTGLEYDEAQIRETIERFSKRVAK